MSRKFEWDENKNRINRTKHKVSFDDVKDEFDDEDRIQYIHYRGGERRWRTIGSIFGILFSVVYTMRSTIFRLISARRASKKEKRDYLHNKSRKE